MKTAVGVYVRLDGPVRWCQRDGYRPGAFNVRVPCNLLAGHAGPCDYGSRS